VDGSIPTAQPSVAGVPPSTEIPNRLSVCAVVGETCVQETPFQYRIVVEVAPDRAAHPWVLSWKKSDVMVPVDTPPGLVKATAHESAPSLMVWTIMGLPALTPPAQPLCELSKNTVSRSAARPLLGAMVKLPPCVVECIMKPPVPTAQLSEPLSMKTDLRRHAQAGTVRPVHVLPS